jgi:hypothetical protein
LPFAHFDKEETYMRIRRRSAVIALLAATLGVGMYAIMANAAIPKGTGVKCSAPRPRPTTDNQSCLNFQFLPNTGLSATTRSPGSIEFRVNQSAYAHPNDTANGGFTSKVQLFLDSDFALTPGTLPKCTATMLANKNPHDALVACGPLGSNNAWLSPTTSTVFNGQADTNGGLHGCVLAFNGKPDINSHPTVVLYTRLYFANPPPTTCPNPRTDTTGVTNVTLTGVLTTVSAPYGKKLTVANIPTSGDALRDFDAKIKRGNYVSGKCSGHNGTIGGSKYWKVKAQWTYSGTPGSNGQPDDVANATQNCSN